MTLKKYQSPFRSGTSYKFARPFILFLSLILPGLLSAEKREFQVMLVPSLDTFFNEKWRFTITESVPRVSRVRQVVRRQYFVPYILLQGYHRAENGRTDLSYDIRMIRPDGQVHMERKGIPAIRGKVLSDDFVLLSANHLRISFDPGDSAGRYLIQVRASDGIGGAVAVAGDEIELVDESSADVPIDDWNDLNRWMQGYYDNPHPEQINSVFFKFVRLSAPEDDAGFIIPMTFFAELYRQNQHLLPELASQYADEGGKSRFYMLHILHLAGYTNEQFYDSLDSSGKELKKQLLEKGWPDPYDGVEQSYELDMLWSTFFATGSFKPVVALVRELEKVNASEKPTVTTDNSEKGDFQADQRQIHYRAAKWSLKANAAHHPLIRDYCRFLLENGKLSNAAKQELNEVLHREEEKPLRP